MVPSARNDGRGALSAVQREPQGLELSPLQLPSNDVTINWTSVFDGVACTTLRRTHGRRRRVRWRLRWRQGVAAAIAPLVMLGAVMTADRWSPFQFDSGEQFVYQITTGGEADTETMIFRLELAPDPESGDDFLRVRSTVEGRVRRSDLQGKPPLVGWGRLGDLPQQLFSHPWIPLLASRVELVPGTESEFIGLGKVKIGEREKVGSREGFLCEIVALEGGEEKKAAELVVDPALPLPLRARIFEGEKTVLEFVLTEHRKE